MERQRLRAMVPAITSSKTPEAFLWLACLPVDTSADHLSSPAPLEVAALGIPSHM